MLFTTLELGPAPQKGTHVGPILGTCFVKKTKKGGSRNVLKISSKKHSKRVPYRRGVYFLLLGVFFWLWTLLGATLLLERSWTSIFHYFGFVLTPKIMFCGPWIHFFRKLFVVVSGCFLGRVHRGVQIVPEKNRGSSPLSKNVF